MPVQLQSNQWSFTSFSASCVKCGRSSEPGDVFYSGLAPATVEEGNDDHEDRQEEGEQEPDQRETAEQNTGQSGGSSEGPTYKRVDYCSECWQTATPDLYSYWRTEVPEPEEDDQEPDRSTLAGLFRGLIQKRDRQQSEDETEREPEEPREGDTEHLNSGLLYLLSLMLMRKGFLALENKESKDGQDQLELRVKGTQDEIYMVHEPELNPELREKVKNKLAELLDMEWDEPD